MKIDRKIEEITIAASQSIKEKEYWMSRLRGNLEKTCFPYDFQGEGNETGALEALKFELAHELNEKLMRLSSGSAPRLFMALTAGLIAVLYKYTGSTDIILGTTIDKQEIQGEFLNSVLALRSRFHRRMSFKELVLNVREMVIGAVENRNYPIEALLYDLKLPEPGKEFPLFDIAILLENIHSREYLKPIKINMVFSFLKTGNSVGGQLEFNPLLYRRETAARIVNHFIATLEQVLVNPGKPVSRINILSKKEKQQLLYDFNRTQSEYPGNKLLQQFFEEEAGKRPWGTALVFEDKHLSYRQLNEEANWQAHHMRKKGAAGDTVVGLMQGISIQMVVAMLGILKAGGAFMPIEPDYPPDRLMYMIKDSNIPLVLTNTKYRNKIENKIEPGNRIKIIDLQDRLSLGNEISNPINPAQPGHLAYVIYTSGSTGNPKGVMVRHSNIVNQMFGLEKRYAFDSSFNHILLAPFTFDPSVQQVFLPLSTGGKLYLVTESTKKDVGKLVIVLVKSRIDILNTVPSLMNLLLEPVNNVENKTLHFKYIILAGEVFSRDLYIKLKHGKTITPGKIINIYGPTEAAINTTAYESWLDEENLPGPPPGEKNLSIPIGKPLLNYKVWIVDEDLELRPPGVPGELCISGAGIARGYLNMPELTNQKFQIQNKSGYHRSYRSHKSYIIYKTGDLARWLPDSNIEFLGRLDYQVKLRGTRIEPGEIERQLEKHKEIKKAVVTAREDKSGDKYLCAYLVMANHDIELKAANMVEYLLPRLPEHMVPAHFIKLKSFPLTSSGKIDRKKLPEPDRETGIGIEYVPPGNQTEEILAEIWKDELGLERVGIKDNFFNIGGDSIKTIKLAMEINKKLNKSLNADELYEYNTIEKLAVLVDERETIPVEENKYAETLQEVEDLKSRIMKGGCEKRE